MWGHLTLFAMFLTMSVTGMALKQDPIAREIIPGIGEYYFNGIAGNWTEAYRQCQASGGYLAVIDSKAEAVALLGIMNKFSATSIHLGFHDQFVEGDYITLNGDAIVNDCTGASPWAPGSPRGGSSYNCGGFNKDGLIDTDCKLDNVFICELNENQGGSNKGDYELLQGHGYYKYNESFVKWADAWANCRQDGANLLVINSEEEVNALYAKYQYPFIWLGAHRFFGGNNDFVTVNGDKLNDTGYTKWGSIQPYGTFLSHPFLGTYLNQGLQTLMERETFKFICEL